MPSLLPTSCQLVLMLFSMLSLYTSAHAQTASPAVIAEKVHTLIPQEGVACLTVRMQQIKTDQGLRLFPWEILGAGTLDELGLDITQVDRVDWIIGPIFNERGKDGAGIIFTSVNKFDLSRLNKELFQPAGAAFRINGSGGPQVVLRNMNLMPMNDNQFAIGYPSTVAPLLSATHGEGELLKQMRRFGENAHVTFVFVLTPIRSLMQQGVETVYPELKADAAVMVDKVQLVAARAQIDTNPVINVLIETANETDAQAVETSWNRFLETFAKMQTVQIGRSSSTGPARDAMAAYLDRANKELLVLLKPTRKGNRLLITLDQRAVNLARGFATLLNLAPTIESMNRRPAASRPPLN